MWSVVVLCYVVYCYVVLCRVMWSERGLVENRFKYIKTVGCFEKFRRRNGVRFQSEQHLNYFYFQHTTLKNLLLRLTTRKNFQFSIEFYL